MVSDPEGQTPSDAYENSVHAVLASHIVSGWEDPAPMPRSLRVDYAGAWHHVMNRGADHRDIFDDNADRAIFLDALALAAERFHLEVHAYCLMSNHFHLLLLSCEGQLSAGMKFLSGRFTRLANVRARRDGPLFRGRYYSVGITSDVHLVGRVDIFISTRLRRA